jgi:long-chain acyl-CoA synthetase
MTGLLYPGAHAQTNPDKPAYVMAGSGETVSYGELNDRSNQLAQLLYERGIRPGDSICICMENNTEFFVACWAGDRSGLYYTAASSRLNVEELEYIVNDCGAQAFITSKHKADVAQALLDKMPRVHTRLMVGGTIDGYESFEDAIAQLPAEPLAEELAGRDMLYSSGTTGRPKGVKVPLAKQPAGSPDGVQLLEQMLWGFTEETLYLSPAPLYHSAPLRFNMGVMRIGGTSVIMEHFDPEEYLRLIEKHKITHTQVVPTMFVRMLKLPEDARKKYDVSSLQSCIHAAAPCPVPVKEQMIEWWGPVIYEYYAGTEGNGFVHCNSEEWMAHKGTVGKAIMGTIHIVGEDGEESPVGEAGTIYFEGGAEFEYHNDP